MLIDVTLICKIKFPCSHGVQFKIFFWRELGIQSTVYNNRVSICPGLHNDKMHASFEKHQKVSSFINCQQNRYNSVKYEVIWKWHFLMLLIKSVVYNQYLPVWTRIGHDLVLVEGRKYFANEGKLVINMMMSCLPTKEELKWSQWLPFAIWPVPWEKYQFCQYTGQPIIPPSSPGDLPLISAF